MSVGHSYIPHKLGDILTSPTPHLQHPQHKISDMWDKTRFIGKIFNKHIDIIA